jgi:hypothetical protein
MKYILIYSGNNGLLYVGNNPIYANAIRQGLPDAEILTLYPVNKVYNKINRQEIFDSKKSWIFSRDTWDITEVDAALDDENFKKTKHYIQIRTTPIEWLMSRIHNDTVKERIYPHDGFELNLAHAINRSDPTTSSWSPEILEYARIVGIEPEHAYKEIALHSESIHMIKMRVYAWQRYFLDKMSNVYTQEHADQIYAEMRLRFTKDLRI